MKKISKSVNNWRR